MKKESFSTENGRFENETSDLEMGDSSDPLDEKNIRDGEQLLLVRCRTLTQRTRTFRFRV